MAEANEIIYQSPPSEADDAFWLQQGRKMLEESITSAREAAKSLMTGLGVLKGIYLGILGFSDFIPKTMPFSYKSLFLLPLLLWLSALYCCLCVMMTKGYQINLRSPDDIRNKSEFVLKAKQSSLQWSFRMLAIGLIVAILLIVFRFKP